MTESSNINAKRFESSVSECGCGGKMKFWGICCLGGKKYEQIVDQRFHLTMAVLDPKSFNKEAGDKIVTLIVRQNGTEYLLCVLKHGEIFQVNLNLIFDKGDNVEFRITGHGAVHLSGYQLLDSNASDDENEYPAVEEKSQKRMKKGSKHFDISESISVSPERKKNEVTDASPVVSFFNMFKNQSDDDDDESDASFSVEDEESESEEDEEDISDDDIDEEEIKDVLEDKEEMEITQQSTPEGSQKRKSTKNLQPEKRLRKDHLSISNSVGNSEDVICIDVNESGSEEGLMDSSIGNTPMPKKQMSMEVDSSEKKKKKKKKRLSEVSCIEKVQVKTDEQQKLPAVVNTPNGRNSDKVKHPIIKLNGGVEVQDVVIGRGPVAAKGKLVSIFYIGRLENKTIFDSRVPTKKPFTFRLGHKEVIQGLDIGIADMRVGGQRKLKIPPNMGYDHKKGLNDVPPNSTLYFTVELQSVN